MRPRQTHHVCIGSYVFRRYIVVIVVIVIIVVIVVIVVIVFVVFGRVIFRINGISADM